MSFVPPEQFNIADYFLDDRIREGLGDKTAIVCGDKALTYANVQSMANRFGNVLKNLGVDEEQRVMIALPDIPEWVGALFGILKIGAVVVMVNPYLKADDIAYFYEYTRAKVAIIHTDTAEAFVKAAGDARFLNQVLVVGGDIKGHASYSVESEKVSDSLENIPTHRDDPAIWLFSGGTTGRPKGVVQTHTSFANTTELYAKNTLGYSKDDITLSIPKLYFGYATGSNLLFPFSVGATTVLFPGRSTPDEIFQQIETHRPTILINVPTMVNHMVSHPVAGDQDLSCLRFATSAGEALPVELHKRWKELFGVDLLDGLGTAEMWHIFVTNRPSDCKPGTLGRVVEGFDLEVRDENGKEVSPGNTGYMWVRGNSRAIGYWQLMEKTQRNFRGEWYVGGDLIQKDADGYVTYCGRGDDMLKIKGKWLAPQEVESCLLQHDSVMECAVVGVQEDTGLVLPHAFVVTEHETESLADSLQAFCKESMESYKVPSSIHFLDELPRTHLGKVDRGKLQRQG